MPLMMRLRPASHPQVVTARLLRPCSTIATTHRRPPLPTLSPAARMAALPSSSSFSSFSSAFLSTRSSRASASLRKPLLQPPSSSPSPSPLTSLFSSSMRISTATFSSFTPHQLSRLLLSFSLSPSLSPPHPPSAAAGPRGVSRAFHSARVCLTVHGDPETDPAGKAAPLLARWEEWRPRVVSYLWIGAVVLTGVVILRAGLWVVGFFSSLDFADVGQVAFFAGLLTAFGLVLLASLGRRALTLRPEAVYHEALKQVLNDVTVRAFLGSELRSGAFRAYSFLPGGIRWPQSPTSNAAANRSAQSPSASPSSSTPASSPTSVPVGSAGSSAGGWSGAGVASAVLGYWRPRRLQLFFQVTGDTGEHGMVSCEVEKVRGQAKYNLLAVDILNTGQRVVLRGDPTYSIYQGVIKLR